MSGVTPTPSLWTLTRMETIPHTVFFILTPHMEYGQRAMNSEAVVVEQFLFEA